MNEIKEFRGEFYFLSNFYNAKIEYNGYRFQNNEAAFQAMKCPDRANEFRYLNGSESKRLGRRVTLREDWETVKDQIMYEICCAKFERSEERRVGKECL